MTEDPQSGAPPLAESLVESPPFAATTVADDLDKALDPNSVIVARFVAAIWMTILAVPVVAVSAGLVFLGDLDTPKLIGLGAGAMAFLALVIWSVYWPGVRYRYASYRVGERGLWIKRGVLFRSEISVPKSRVQHTDVSQGPLQRRFDLATLILHTAGTQHAAVALGGLSHQAALAIRDYLIEGGPDDAV